MKSSSTPRCGRYSRDHTTDMSLATCIKGAAFFLLLNLARWLSLQRLSLSLSLHISLYTYPCRKNPWRSDHPCSTVEDDDLVTRFTIQWQIYRPFPPFRRSAISKPATTILHRRRFSHPLTTLRAALQVSLRDSITSLNCSTNGLDRTMKTSKDSSKKAQVCVSGTSLTLA